MWLHQLWGAGAQIIFSNVAIAPSAAWTHLKVARPEIPEEEMTDFSREDPENLVWEETFADQSCQHSGNETRTCKKCIKVYNPRLSKSLGLLARQQEPSLEKKTPRNDTEGKTGWQAGLCLPGYRQRLIIFAWCLPRASGNVCLYPTFPLYVMPFLEGCACLLHRAWASSTMGQQPKTPWVHLPLALSKPFTNVSFQWLGYG